jgi:hypothetical protein
MSLFVREAKKLCKKLKVSPEPFLLKHYKDGEFHKDYDRLETAQSMVNFMRDPAGDIPWEEDSSAVDVVHISDASVSFSCRRLLAGQLQTNPERYLCLNLLSDNRPS